MNVSYPLAAVLLAAATGPAGAGTPNPDMETLTVTETRSGGLATDFPGHVTVIDNEEIRGSGALHLVDVLRGQAGLAVSDLYGDGSRATLSMRGFGANAQANTLVMVDGRRLNNADLGSPDLNSIALKDIRRIEILQGSAGSLYGDQAVGGLVNVITREPEDFSAGLQVDTGSYDHYAATARLANRHASGISYRFSGELRRADNYRDHNRQEYDNLFGRLQYDHDDGRVFAEVQWVGEDLQTPGALYADQVAADRRRAANPEDYIATDTYTLRLGLEQAFLSDWRLRTEYSYRRADGDGRLSVGGVSGTVATAREQQQLTPRIVALVDTGHGDLQATVGVDLVRTDFSLQSILGRIDNRQTRTSVYAQVLYPLTRRLTLTLGGRHASVENRIDGALLPPGTVIDDDVNAVEAGLSLQVNDALRVYGRFDGNFRFVLADEYTSASFGGVIPETQTGRSWEAGLAFRRGGLSIDASAYRLELDDEIDFDPLKFINTNIGDTRRQGLALNLSWQATQRLSLSANLDYVDARVKAGPLEGLDIPFVAAITGSGNARYRFSDRVHGYLEIRGIGDRVASGDFFNAGRELQGHVMGNLYLAWESTHWTAGLRVNNFLGTHYSDNAQLGFRPPSFAPETTYYPAPGRNFLVSLKYHID